MLPTRTQVLIVGAGPTGLALAAALGQAGIDHVLIDARDAAPNTSRAAVVHAHTLEMLARIGVAEALRAQALALDRFTIRDRDQHLLGIGFANLPSSFRHILMVPQSTTEAILEARHAELGGRIHRGVTALRLAADERGATVRVRTAAGEQTIEARYVVGADGMHSIVRDAAGIAFRGEAYGESFILADVRMDWPLGAGEVSLFFSPAGMVVVAPLPDGSYRVVATVDDAPERPGVADVQHLLDARGPAAAPARVDSVAWSSRFRVHHRLADSYRRGPFLLIGDAAHVHSPAGGQGMNTGLVDAILLGEALTRVIRDREPETLLDAYSRVRRQAAQQVLPLAARLTRLATMRSASARRLRNLALRLLDRAAWFRRKLSLDLSGVARRHFSVLPAPTRRVPVAPSRPDSDVSRAFGRPSRSKDQAFQLPAG